MSQTAVNTNNPEELKNEMFSFYFSDVLKGLFKFWWIIVALTIIFGSCMFGLSYLRYVPTYTVSSTFTVSTSSKSTSGNGITSYSYYYDSVTAGQLSDSFPYILTSNILQDSICEEIKMDYMPATLTASSVKGSNMFTITCTGTDPQKTYDVLVAAIKKYPDVARYVVGNIKLTLITNPAVPTEPSNQRSYINKSLKGAALGFVLGLAWVMLYAFSRNTIRKKEDIKKELGQNVIGTLPDVTFKKYNTEIDRTIIKTNERIGSGFLESLRVLRNSFIHEVPENDKVILVTSTAPGEGKTTVCVNLALSLADLGKKVLLIDGDVRNPSVCKALNLDSENLEYKIKDKYYAISEPENLGISIMTLSLDEDYWKVMRVEKVKELFDIVRDSYDYVLVDTPPCGLVSDTSIIAQAVDAAVYVILQDTVRISRIKSGIDNIILSYTKIIGCVFNGAASGAVGYGENYGYAKYGHYGKYGYGYGYGYGYADKKKKESSKKHRKA